MNNKYYLALADEVEFSNKAKVNKVIRNLFILAIILLIASFWLPYLIMGSSLIKWLIVIAFIVVFTYVAERFILTTKTFNQKLKLQGISKVMMIIYCVFLTLIVLIALKEKILLFKLPLYQIMVAALAAILPAICEEFLFRGVLFNAFLLVFNKEKYDILWTSIVCSILFGLVLSYLRVWSNGLIWGMIVHFLQDFSPKILNTDYGTSKIKLAILGVIPVVILMLICIYTINRRFLKIK
ncbi:CPBP family intramembrane glutamic endopeptidase [uncultured Lactobacillus sp.]|uniref:CPBP family glutamic-type intramembrane protease n=1 Tax=uncultured Lactobacillus sp. TaxID=153152 RepID=UPI002616206B|nr:CPBP family intramembrane glutamic endopeptidase [uncultured Lactobacillus sp.]